MSGVIVALLVASGLVRLGDGVGAAFATETAGGTPPAEPETTCVADGQTEAMLEAIRSREARVALSENELADRLQALRVAESEIASQLTVLQEAEASLAATLALADTAAASDVDRLVAVYENMKPQEAAALFEEMAPDFAAGFIGRMRPDAAAAVLGRLAPATAYSLSVVLAGRNAGAPTE